MSVLTRTELRLYLRDGATLFWGLAFPPVLLALVGAVPSFRERSADLGGARPIDLYVPVCVAFVIGMLALSALPSVLASYRERGVLRRLATTPVGPRRLVEAQLTVNAGLMLVPVVLVLVLARLAYDVGLPEAPLAWLLAFVLTGAALLGLGVLIAAVAPSARVATAVGSTLWFPLMFFAGLWFPREAMSDALRTVSDLTPLGAGVGALQAATEGAFPDALHLLVLVAYAAVCGTLAVRLFRWE